MKILNELTDQYTKEKSLYSIQDKIRKAELKMEEKQRLEEHSSFDGTPRSARSHVTIDGDYIPVQKPRKLTIEDQFQEVEQQTL